MYFGVKDPRKVAIKAWAPFNRGEHIKAGLTVLVQKRETVTRPV